MENISKQIAEMVEVDQAARSENPINWAKVKEIDTRNTEMIKKIIQEYGWITIDKFGEETSHQAWLLVQHADHDIEFQEHCLDLMMKMDSTQVLKKDIGLLTDRVLMKKRGFQKYGTQHIVNSDHILIQPVESPEKLDQLRAEMGMLPYAEKFKDSKLPVFLAVRKKLM